MEIRVVKLLQLLALMKPVVPKKPTIKAVSFIIVGDRKAVATDLETMVMADLPEAVEPMLLPFLPLLDMLKYVPSTETLKIESEGHIISLSWTGGSASYPTEDYRDFPILSDMSIKAEGMVNGDALIPALLEALPYVSDKSERAVLNGVTLVLGNPVEVAAGDGFRMSHRTLGLSFPVEEKIIVPAHSVAIMGHIFAQTPRTPPANAPSLVPILTAKRELHLSLLGDTKLRVDFGATSVVVNLISGQPPAWLSLIPAGEPVLKSHLFAPELEAAVKRVRDVAKDDSGIVRLVFANGKLTVSAQGEGQAISAIINTLDTQGETGRTAINQKYLLEYLSGKTGIISFSKYGDAVPVIFQYQRSPRVLIMPMHVDWEDKAPAPPETPTAQEQPETTPAGEPFKASPQGEPASSNEQQMGEEIPENTEEARLKPVAGNKPKTTAKPAKKPAPNSPRRKRTKTAS